MQSTVPDPRSPRIVGSLSAVLCLTGAAVAEVTGYSWTPLPGEGVLAKAISSSGSVAGDGPTGGLIWQGGTVVEIPQPPGMSALQLADINTAGHVVGKAAVVAQGDLPTALLYDGEVVVNLSPNLAHGEHAEAVSINDQGLVVGTAHMQYGPSSYVNRAVIWDQSVASVIEPLALDLHSAAIGVNNHGDVLVRSGDGAFIWNSGTVTTLSVPEMFILDFNDEGQIAGYWWAENGGWGAVIWTDGAITALPGLGGASSQAWALSNEGHAVGSAQVPSGIWHAVLWREGQVFDLNECVAPPVGATLTLARDMNGTGQIVAQATDDAGATIAILLTPLPTGDLTGDGLVDTTDFLLLLEQWGPCGAGACSADLNGDGAVGTSDLLTLLANWS